jgi:hypothetical protein
VRCALPHENGSKPTQFSGKEVHLDVEDVVITSTAYLLAISQGKKTKGDEDTHFA